MKKKMLNLILLLPILLLSGCSKYVSSDFFDNYEWTKWISKDDNVEILIEGKGQNNHGYGVIKQISSIKYNIYMDGYGRRRGFLYSGGSANTEVSTDQEYILHVFDSKIDINLKPIKILPGEIDLRYCMWTEFYNSDTFLRFSWFNDYENFQEVVTWQLYTKKEQKNIFLTISDNKQFVFKQDELVAKGTYFATYEDVTFNFDENQIFEGKENLVFEMV